MALPTTDIGIGKLALANLGSTTQITSISAGTTKEEILLNEYYSLDVDEVLKEGEWRFAQQRRALALAAAWNSGTTYAQGAVVLDSQGDTYVQIQEDSTLNSVPADEPLDWELVTRAEWTYCFALPSTFLAARFIYPRDSRIPFDLEADRLGNQYLLTNEEEPTLVFTARVAAFGGDPTSPIDKWSVGFIKALSWRLAADLAGPLTQDAQKIGLAEQRYQQVLAKALAAEYRQTQSAIQAEASSSFLISRR